MPDLPGKVIAYSFFNASENFDTKRAKLTFYTHRIFSILFPFNFPKIHAAVSETKDKNKGTVRQQIHPEKDKNRPIRHSFESVLDFFEKELQINPYYFFDLNEQNLIVSEDGNEYFVDLVNTFDGGAGSIGSILIKNQQKIIAFMEKRKEYDEDDILRVNNSIDRLKVIESN